MENYVISLKTKSERRFHICNEFKKKDVNFTFIDAITPEENKETAMRFGLKIENFDLTPTEISCFLSHLVALKNGLDRKNNYISVFEDDIYLGESADLFLTDETWIPSNIDIIKLEAFSEKAKVNKIREIKTLDGRSLYKLRYKHIGAAGYIISSEKANEVLNKIKIEKNIKPFDHYIFEDLIYTSNIYQLLPAICIQDFIKNKSYNILGSSLEEERRERFNKRKLNDLDILSKIKREFLRVLNQIYKAPINIIYGIKVTFR